MKDERSARKLIFWDVDTQHDFMMPDGKLYVKGAELILDNLKRLTLHARENKIQVCGSVDYHLLSDSEISDHPDLHETFPPHCLQGTPGQEKVPATKPVNPLWIDSRGYEHGGLAAILRGYNGEIILRKQKFDVFSNPNVLAVLDYVHPTDIVVYGVALDVCDAHAIEGFLHRGRYRLYLVLDAVRAIYEDKGKELIENWKTRGVQMITTYGAISLLRHL